MKRYAATRTDVDFGTPGPDSVLGWGRVLLPVVPRDTTRPVTTTSAATVKRGSVATLSHEVDDADFSAGPASVTIPIKNAGGELVKTLGPYEGVPMCTPQSAWFTCRLPKGVYRFSVTAVDSAGNAATQVGAGRLTVKQRRPRRGRGAAAPRVCRGEAAAAAARPLWRPPARPSRLLTRSCHARGATA